MTRLDMTPLIATAFALVLIGCATYDSSERHESASQGKAHGNLGIPPRHLPGPGECRIWFPARSPGQQPPPHDCRGGHASVPRGAWLIEHSSDDPENVHVNVYDPKKRRIEIRIYNAETGAHVSTRIPG